MRGQVTSRQILLTEACSLTVLIQAASKVLLYDPEEPAMRMEYRMKTLTMHYIHSQPSP